LRKAGLKVENEKAIAVHYDGLAVGNFSADMLVDGRVMLELKANQTLAPANEVQLVNYLTATGIEVGLLLNLARSDWSSNGRQEHIVPGNCQTISSCKILFILSPCLAPNFPHLLCSAKPHSFSPC
jgi:hypothetical protein